MKNVSSDSRNEGFKVDKVTSHGKLRGINFENEEGGACSTHGENDKFVTKVRA